MIHEKKNFNRLAIVRTLLEMFIIWGGTIEKLNKIKNMANMLMSRKSDYESIWEVKTILHRNVESLLLILIAGEIFAYECKYNL